MSTNVLVVSGRDTVNRSGGDVAGLKLAWLGENIEGSVDDPQFRQVTLTAQKAAILAEASVELLEDAANFQGQLVTGFAESMRVGLDTAFLHGTGAGMPMGILNSPCLVTVNAESGQAADTIVAPNIRKMLSRMLAGSFNRSVWIAHPSTLEALLNLNVIFESGGSAVGGQILEVFRQDGDNWRLYGRPVRFTECANELGDVGDIILADLSYYAVGLRREAGIETSNAPGWTRFAQNFRFYMRVAGLPLLDAPVTPVRGTGTLSPFIALAART